MSIRDVGPAVLLLLAAAFVTVPAQATVELRVEARPIADPIEAFITVTDANGPVTGLTAADFVVTLDGDVVPTQDLDFTLPPSQDPANQKVSVVFAMDYSSSITDQFLVPMQQAVIAFIDAMNAGDYAAIIKFNNDSGAVVVQPFTVIDDGGVNDQALVAAVMADFTGDGSNILDATQVAVEQFAAHPDPTLSGPKAVILVTDGIETHSTATAGEVISVANDSSIPIFAVGIGAPDQEALDLMGNLASQTGGEFILAPSDQDIQDAYATIQFLLSNEYLLTFASSINDCAEHTLAVTVGAHGSGSATFTRRECDTIPDAFSFTSQAGVEPNTSLRSNTLNITGLEAPAPISITTGQYSIGCGDSSTFTGADGTIANNQTVCVRHTSSSAFSTSKVTTLNIGGVSGTFTTTTRADSGGGGGGGGGATGVVELLLGLAALLARRRLRA